MNKKALQLATLFVVTELVILTETHFCGVLLPILAGVSNDLLINSLE